MDVESHSSDNQGGTPGALQHLEMFGNRRLAHRKRLGQLQSIGQPDSFQDFGILWIRADGIEYWVNLDGCG
jgi:hypothetical protein